MIAPRHTRFTLAIVLLAVALTGSADEPAAHADEAPTCDAVEVDYALSANLELSDTPMGQGDSTHRIGPGVATLRYRTDAPQGTPVQLVHYRTTERFTLTSRTLFFRTRVTTDTHTSTGTDGCGVVASGVLSDRSLVWSTNMRAVRTDGTLHCDGSLCGMLGAPPRGSSAVHVAPHDVRLNAWVFSPDRKTFTMGKTWVAHTDAPQQTSHIALAGRELRRRCVNVAPCRP